MSVPSWMRTQRIDILHPAQGEDQESVGSVYVVQDPSGALIGADVLGLESKDYRIKPGIFYGLTLEFRRRRLERQATMLAELILEGPDSLDV